ncbi:unnamed protein product [Darwinula stevensoni]|uniref:ABC transporter domain-containing protein n=1 Tax=Darwinula stevensoni TaxID=69355 RepID=A0A7R8XEJ8_9CRUS|nr:unnamed protein product [Darwinula stevensoni]CAG0895867.1 unnamed protein product [Darwinula stevensoni]
MVNRREHLAATEFEPTFPRNAAFCPIACSGAGKSSLVGALAHRQGPGVIVDGRILANGCPAASRIPAISGFVYQDEIFMPSLTPREHLTLMVSAPHSRGTSFGTRKEGRQEVDARLKLDRRTPAYSRRSRVEHLLQDLGLRSCQEALIGEPGANKSLSGGERKRLAFATEILRDPSVLFCDELTTGLDSFHACRLVGILRDLSGRGKTVVCSIHQPSSDVFALFDRIMLLADGRVAFAGHATEALRFFESQGYRCPSSFNPADFYLHVLSTGGDGGGDRGDGGGDSRWRDSNRRICDAFAVSPLALQTMAVVQYFHNIHLSYLDSGEEVKDPALEVKIERPGYAAQVCLLLWRDAMDIIRNPAVLKLRLVQKLLLAVIIGFIYMGLGRNQRGIQDTEGAIFVFLTENSFLCTYAVLQVFPRELPVFLREHRNGVCSLPAYYSSKVISQIPLFVVEPFVFTLVAYFLAGMRAGAFHFLMTAVGIVLVANTAAAAGFLFSASFDSVSMVVIALTPFMFTQVVTGGFFLSIETIPWFLNWTQYLSWFRYSNEALTTLQWHGVQHIECEYEPGEAPCLSNGTQVLEKYSFSACNFTLDYAMLLFLFLLFHLLAFFMLWSRVRRK